MWVFYMTTHVHNPPPRPLQLTRKINACCHRATCRQPRGSASPGWRWPECWWNATNTKRGWWSCRRLWGGRRWSGADHRAPGEHGYVRAEDDKAWRDVVLSSPQGVQRKPSTCRKEEIQHLAVVSLPHFIYSFLKERIKKTTRAFRAYPAVDIRVNLLPSKSSNPFLLSHLFRDLLFENGSIR